MVSCFSPPYEKDVQDKKKSENHWSSCAPRKDIRPYVDGEKKENALFPFFFSVLFFARIARSRTKKKWKENRR